jgi:hypothetical protein
MESPQRRYVAISDHALQQTVGWIALAMPLFVRAVAFLYDGIWTTNSISAYYYTSLRDVFVGSLVVGGAVLAFFPSPHAMDRWLARIAGTAAVGIALFPMTIEDGVIDWVAATTREERTAYVQALEHGPHGPLHWHYFFVVVFFVIVFYLVTFRFKANTPDNPTPRKCRRNNVYAVCGYLMAAAFLWMAGIWLVNRNDQNAMASIFYPETLAVMAFAAAWLVKGQLVLKDRQRSAPVTHPAIKIIPPASAS